MEALTPEWLGAIVSAGWLLLALLAFLAALPIVLRLTREKSFSVRIAGFELSVQDATLQLGSQIRDLQDRIRELEGARAEFVPEPRGSAATIATPFTAPAPSTQGRPRRILWVDDNPAGNAFAVDKLRSDGFEVVLCETTASGLKQFRSMPFGFVISDIGRTENGKRNNTAGLELLRQLRSEDSEVPVVLYSSMRAASAYRDQGLQLGALDVTPSLVQVLAHISRQFGDSTDSD